MLTKQQETNKQVENEASAAVGAATQDRGKQLKRVEVKENKQVAAAAQDHNKQVKHVEVNANKQVKHVEAKSNAKVAAAVCGYGEHVQQLNCKIKELDTLRIYTSTRCGIVLFAGGLLWR